jgi:hypothetical protein
MMLSQLCAVIRFVFVLCFTFVFVLYFFCAHRKRKMYCAATGGATGGIPPIVPPVASHL